MTYKVFFKTATITVENVAFINFHDEEIVLLDSSSVILCIANKSEYEGILKVE